MQQWTFYRNGRVVAHEVIGLHGVQFQMRTHGAQRAESEDGQEEVWYDGQYDAINGGES